MPGLMPALNMPGGGGGGPQGTVGNTQYAQVSPTNDPTFKNMLGDINSRIDALRPPSFSDLLAQGMNSPLLQQVLGPALQRLQPGQDLARQNMMDEFRQAGAMGSSAQGNAGVNLERAFGDQNNSLISQVISSMMPQFVQGLQNQFQEQTQPISLLEQALGMTRPDTVTGQLPGVPGGGGGGGGGGGVSHGGITDPFATPGNMNPGSNWRYDKPVDNQPPDKPPMPSYDSGDLSGSWGAGGGGGTPGATGTTQNTTWPYAQPTNMNDWSFSNPAGMDMGEEF